MTKYLDLAFPQVVSPEVLGASLVTEDDTIDIDTVQWHWVAGNAVARVELPEPKVYAVEKFHLDTVSVGWGPATGFYRDKKAADLFVRQQNAQLLRQENERRQKLYLVALRRYQEYQALVAAGLRDGFDDVFDPGEFQLVTQLTTNMERYRVVEVSFDDERVGV